MQHGEALICVERKNTICHDYLNLKCSMNKTLAGDEFSFRGMNKKLHLLILKGKNPKK